MSFSTCRVHGVFTGCIYTFRKVLLHIIISLCVCCCCFQDRKDAFMQLFLPTRKHTLGITAVKERSSWTCQDRTVDLDRGAPQCPLAPRTGTATLARIRFENVSIFQLLSKLQHKLATNQLLLTRSAGLNVTAADCIARAHVYPSP